MAPSNVFHYLRPHHRSKATTPTSPQPPSVTSPSPAHESFPSSRPEESPVVAKSPVSPFPPVLPPIPRIASRYEPPAPHKLIPEFRPDSSLWALRQSEDGSHENRTPQSTSKQSQSDHALTPTVLVEEVQEVERGHQIFGRLGHKIRSQSRGEVDSEKSSRPPLASAATAPAVSPMYSKPHSSTTSLGGEKPYESPKILQLNTPTQTPKSGKNKLNLLNPMSLLMRRRSSQVLEQLSEESLISRRTHVPPMSLSDDYDPRIRGVKVHDFSAPRPRRNFSYNDISNAPARSSSSLVQEDRKRTSADGSPVKFEREHTPVFKEHFEDDVSYSASESALRAESLANHQFLARVTIPPPDRVPPPPPPPLIEQTPPGAPREIPPPAEDRSEPSQLSTSPSALHAIKDLEQSISTKTPSKRRSHATSGADNMFVPAGLPSHMTSKASRFSFQIAGVDSAAQEQLLEERHRKKAAAKAAAAAQETKQQQPLDLGLYDEDDMYDDFDMDADDGFEERIPGVNADFDEDDYGMSMPNGLGDFDFTSTPLHSMTPIHINGKSPNTPRDIDGNPIGLAVSREASAQQLFSQPATNPVSTGSPPPVRGLGLLMDKSLGPGMEPSGFTPAATPAKPGLIPQDSVVQSIEEDDLYFDDGLIDDLQHDDDDDDDDGQHFDESVFDDPNHPLFERRPPKPPTPPSPHDEDEIELSNQERYSLGADNGALFAMTGKQLDDSPSSPQMPKASFPPPNQPPHDSKVMFGNLESLHSALAQAANKAAADGRFNRKDSIDTADLSIYESRDELSQNSPEAPGLIADEGQPSQQTSNYPSGTGLGADFGVGGSLYDIEPGFEEVNDDYDYSDYDSALEGDPMVAAANAEALANDLDGFYGREFGFYARPSDMNEAEFANGGYFGARDLGRSISGRNAVREPNLTPITERSEYSTRNSFIGLNHFNNSSGALPSPGLAQLARMSPYGFGPDESNDDISLNQLRKLRNKAWGGSQASIGSAASSPRGSSPIPAQWSYFNRGASPMAGPGMNAWEEDSESDDDDDDNANVVLERYEDDSPGVEEEGEEDEVEDDEDADGDEDEDEDVASLHEFADSRVGSTPESPTIRAANFSSLATPDSQAQEDDSRFPYRMSFQDAYAHQTPGPFSPSSIGGMHSPVTKHSPHSPHLYLHTRRTSSEHPGSPTTDTTGTATITAVASPTSPRMASHSRNGSAESPTMGKGHSRQASATDSVTYVKEKDGSGKSRWVLERRRTSGTGELELIGREVVSGGKI